jgi:hypothetical protein
MTEKRTFIYPLAIISIDEEDPGFAFGQPIPEDDFT